MVENAELLIRTFGEWPSFHDAEVLAMHLDRAGEDGPSLTACIHVFRMTGEIDPDGYYRLTHHTRATLRFTDIVLRQLRWFNGQNSLADLVIEKVDPGSGEERRFRVGFDANWGVEAEFLCDRVVVESVEPYEPPAS